MDWPVLKVDFSRDFSGVATAGLHPNKIGPLLSKTGHPHKHSGLNLDLSPIISDLNPDLNLSHNFKNKSEDDLNPIPST